MIVSIGAIDDPDQRFVLDAAALVVDPDGCVRICRDGQEDEVVDPDVIVVVTE